MELKSGDLLFFIKSFCGKITEVIQKKNREDESVKRSKC